MAKRLFLTENYVAQCAHGGKVIPKGTSSTPNVVCAGVPIVNIQDLPGTPISGCPKKSPCTAVANFTSGSAEMNNKSGGVNLALDLVGIKSNKGAAISLSFNGQTVAGASPLHKDESEIEEEEPTQNVIEEQKEKKQKEKYNLYLIRQSKDSFLEKVYKPLRASRKFQKMEEYFSFDITTPNSNMRDKVFTKILSYVYIKLASGKIDEYKITSKGSVSSQTLKEIRYKDEQNYEHKYIPLYDEKNIEIYYTNVQLSSSQTKRKEQLSNFEALSFNPSKPKNNDFYIKDVDSININEISPELLNKQKKYDPVKYNQNYPFDIIVNINDPIGQIEDLYNTFEFKFKNNYSYNNFHIQHIKKLNAYVYTVANHMDYLYVSPQDQKIYDEHLEKLKNLYTKLANGILEGSLSSIILKDIDNIKPLDEIINENYDLAVNYFNEVMGVNKAFFKDLELDNCDDKCFELSHNFVEAKYYGVIDNTHIHDQNETRLRKLKQNEQNLLDKFVNLTSDIDFIYLYLDNVNNPKYLPYRQKPQEMLALLVFSICFSNKYKKEVEKEGLEQTVKEFYFALKNSPRLPSISNKSIEEIRDIIKYQKDSYEPILSRENKLLEQYKSLEDINKQYSYDIKSAKSSPKEQLNDLYVPKEYSSFVYEDEKITAKKVHETLQKAINQDDVKKQIKAHLNLKEFDTKQKELDFLNTMVNLSYFFIANRTKMDLEANTNSPFSKDKLHIYELIENITTRRLKLEESFAQEVDSLPIIEHYSQALIAHIVHSLVEGDKNKDGFSLRSKKVHELFASLEKQSPNSANEVLQTDITNLLDANFELELKTKSAIERLNSNIVTAIGMNANAMGYVDNFSSRRTVVKTHRTVNAKVGEFMDMGNSPADSSDSVRQSAQIPIKKFYKNYILLSKSASQFITVINLGSFVLGKKALKNEDIFPLMESTGKLIGFISEAMPKTKTLVIEQIQKIVTTQSLKEISKFNVLAKIGMVGIVVSTYYEVAKLDETDIDGQVAIVMKNTLELALLLIPLYATIPIVGFGAAVIVLAIDIAWRFYIRDIFVDSAIETYLFKSLLFNHKHQPSAFGFLKVVNPLGYAFYCAISSHFDDEIAYNTLLLKEVVNKDKELIKGFSTFKELQGFIGENYKAYEDKFEEALRYELTNLQIALNDYKVQIEDKKVNYLEGIKENLSLKTQIKIPKETMQNNVQVILQTNNYNRTISTSPILKHGELPSMPDDFYYDTVVNSMLRSYLHSNISTKHFENIYLLVINRDVVLKYKLSYSAKARNQRGGQVQKIRVILEEIKLSPLLKKDGSLIEKVLKERKEKE